MSPAVPRISVIIPAYNASRTIGRAVRSVLAQTLPVHETLVVDDGSRDDLESALRPFGTSVTLLRKPNGGAASARNLGIDHATGDLIAFLDADDYWEPTKLERQWEVLQRHPEVGLVSCDYYNQEPGSPERSTRPWRAEQRAYHDRVVTLSGPDVLSFTLLLTTPALLVRRSVLGHRRFDTTLSTAEDRDLWIRLVASTPVFILSEPLVTIVLEPGSLSRSNADDDYPNMIQVVHRHQHLLGTRQLREWEALLYRQWAACNLGQGRPRAALMPAWNRVRKQPLSPEGWWILLKCAIRSLAPRRDRIPAAEALATCGTDR